MSRLKPVAPFVLIGWTLVLWAGRLDLAWTITDDSTAAKWLATIPVAVFVLFALVAALTVLRRGGRLPDGTLDRAARRAVGILAAWTIGYWIVRLPMILTNDHPIPFKLVHTVLAVISWSIAGWVGIGLARRKGFPPLLRDDGRQAPEMVTGTSR